MAVDRPMDYIDIIFKQVAISNVFFDAAVVLLMLTQVMCRLIGCIFSLKKNMSIRVAPPRVSHEVHSVLKNPGRASKTEK